MSALVGYPEHRFSCDKLNAVINVSVNMMKLWSDALYTANDTVFAYQLESIKKNLTNYSLMIGNILCSVSKL